MTYCESCQSLEPETKFVYANADDENGILVCAECLGDLTEVPEHDDYDMER